MKNYNPLVSILVPVYNVENYLAECLNSLINQTLKNIEIVCVNDGSTDKSATILQDFAKRDPRIIIVNKKNGGLPSARNAGIDVARGKYVGFIDSDDYADINMFEKMYNKAIAENADIVVCGGHPFPNEKQAGNWLKDILSPRDIVYKNNIMTALFDERGAQPFLWRNLVRRELIEENNLRLDENVILGEDVAFQFKIFSHAKCVAFMSDKFYYYRYSRPNSIMNDSKFADYGARIFKHVYMLENTLKTLKDNGTLEDNAPRYFNWAVDFIYWDFIKVSASDRAKIADFLKKLFFEYNFYAYSKQLWQSTRDYFKFITKYCGKTFEEPELSVVIVANGNETNFSTLLDSVVCQSKKDTEILLYLNGSNDNLFAICNKYLNLYDNICFRTGENTPINEKYNDAIKTAKGKYITFVDSLSHVSNSLVFENACKLLNDSKIDLVGSHLNLGGLNDVLMCECAKFKNFVYKLKTIRENNLSFSDYAFWTGAIFFTNYCKVTKKVYFVDELFVANEKMHRTSIWADEAKLLLKAMVQLLQIAREKNLTNLSKKITGNLNSENYSKLITNSTYGFDASAKSINDSEQDFHTEILELLIEANKLSSPSEFDTAISKTLSDFIAKRHKFLEQF